MMTHFNTLAGKIPRTEEPGGVQCMGLQSRTQLKGLSVHACSHTELHGEGSESLQCTFCLHSHGSFRYSIIVQQNFG